MKNTAGSAYAGWPDRIYVIGKDGSIAMKGERGPWGFDPAAAERSLQQMFRKKGEARRY